MKTLLSVLVLLAGISAHADGIEPKQLWDCHYGNVKTLSIFELNGKYSAVVSWNCSAGDDACKIKIDGLKLTDDGLHGNTDFSAPNFDLNIDTDVVKDAGCMSGIYAISQGPKENGGGIVLDTRVYCNYTGN